MAVKRTLVAGYTQAHKRLAEWQGKQSKLVEAGRLASLRAQSCLDSAHERALEYAKKHSM